MVPLLSECFRNGLATHETELCNPRIRHQVAKAIQPEALPCSMLPRAPRLPWTDQACASLFDPPGRCVTFGPAGRSRRRQATAWSRTGIARTDAGLDDSLG